MQPYLPCRIGSKRCSQVSREQMNGRRLGAWAWCVVFSPCPPASVVLGPSRIITLHNLEPLPKTSDIRQHSSFLTMGKMSRSARLNRLGTGLSETSHVAA